MKKNEIIEIKIDSVSTDGNGVGRYENIPVFVPLSAVGDFLRVKIIKITKNYLVGKILEILEEGKGRIAPDCDVFEKCGGCALRHIDYKTECEYKRDYVKNNLRKIGKIDAPVSATISADNESFYRNKVIIPIRTGENGKIQAGFFAARSHRLIECENCLLQPEIFSKIAKTTINLFEKHKTIPYNEETGEGIIRNLYLRISENGDIMLCFIVSSKFSECEIISKEVVKAHPEIKTVLLNINKRRDNVLLGDKTICLLGEGFIEDSLLGLKFKISAPSFYQINHSQTEKLYSLAKKLAAPKETDTILDLYCGIGTIGLTMARNVRKLIGIEIVPEAIENAKENARLNGIENAEFFCADAGTGARKIIERGDRINTVIVDPPRKGCDEETLNAIKTINPEKIVMISCNSATLARDLSYLLSSGYKIDGSVYPLDMFPRTPHIETAVCLIRK